MRKFLAALLSVVCLTCLAIAVSCSVEPNYYILTFESFEGAEFDFGKIENGAQVKEGYVVNFKLTVDENKVAGDESVMLNGKRIYPSVANTEGSIRQSEFSFEMKEDTAITLEGVYSLSSSDIVFDKGDWRIHYLDLEGNELSELKDVSSGESISFKLDVSVYYDKSSEYSVLANTQIIKPDENGIYTFTASRDTTVSVRNLETDESFLTREDGGSGTEEDPFIIKRPIDLYAMADYVNNDYYTGRYGLAYYKMVEDIDMEGEQLFIIGDGTGSYAFFMGDFNGNGHKIENFYISDTLIEQSEFQTVFLNYIGLFGRALASAYGPANIYGLTLDGFTINVNSGYYKESAFVGAIAGAAIGANIYNCSAINGTITADADNGKYTNMGGLVGVLQSAYSATISHDAYLAGCYSNVAVSGESGYVYTGGGLVGSMISADEYANAYIVNSHYSGEVTGAMQTGGIAGYASPYSSVKNCWAEGKVVATNNIRQSSGFEDYLYAYAGGLVGNLDHSSVVANSFSLSSTFASAQAGSSYASTGVIAGTVANSNAEIVQSFPGAVINCAESSSAVNTDYIKNTLGWSEADWSFGGTYPTVKANYAEKSASVTLVCGSTEHKAEGLNSAAYRTIYSWYQNGLDEFVSENGNRSYGYYFDKELTEKVPDAYVITGNEKLYYGLADYTEVAGTYYLQTEVKGSGIYIELSEDGKLLYRNGALNLLTTYIYDGSKLTLFGCPAFTEYLEEYVLDENGNPVSDGNGGYLTTKTPYYTGAVAQLENGRLTLVNGMTFTTASPLRAVKEIEGFVYGGYYTSDGTEYYFNTDGTGTVGNRDFTYAVNGSDMTVLDGSVFIGGKIVNGEVKNVGDVTLSKYDPFAGTWEKSATTHVEYTFDGKGGWIYEYYEYIGGSKHVLSTSEGTYTYNSEEVSITLNNGVIASFDKNGMLQITNTNLDFTQSYFNPSSLVGTWRYFFKPEAIEITFGGIGKDGYGKATVFYETLDADVEFTYHVAEENGVPYIYLYDEDILIGVLYYNTNNFTLGGSIYSYKEDEIIYAYQASDEAEPVEVVAFCLYDEYKGEWLGEEWGVVNFNGLGAYNLNGVVVGGATINVAVSGSVTINGASVRYSLENATMNGTFSYGGTTYAISYDEVKNVVTVTADGKSFKLVRPDSLYGLNLIDSDNTVYSFDGGSGHDNGGTLTIGTTNYKYKVSADGTITVLSGNSSVGTITIKNSGYVLAMGGTEKTLTVQNSFTGEWNVSGTLGELKIDSIGATLDGQDVKFVAAGIYLGKSYTFEFDAAEERLSFTDNGKTYYITAMFSAANGTELKIAEANASSSASATVYCVKSGALDEYRGTYSSSDGVRLVLDGFSNSAYAKGSAKLFDSNSGTVTASYTYSLNEFGVLELRSGNVYKLLVETDKTAEGAYVNGETAYAITDPDNFYLVKAEDYFDEVFTFDGLGTVKTSKGLTYSYTVLQQTEDDVLNHIYRMQFTDKDKVKHDVKLDYSTADYTVTFTDVFTGIVVSGSFRSPVTGNNEDFIYSFVYAGYIEYSETSTDKSGLVTTLTTLYSYTVASSEDNLYTLMLSAENGTKRMATVKIDDDKVEFNITDDLYNKTVKDDNNVEYTFDGFGNVTASDGKKYTYAIARQTAAEYENKIFRLTLTAADGTTSSVTVRLESNTLTFNAAAAN